MISEPVATHKNTFVKDHSSEPQLEPSDQEVSKVKEWIQCRCVADLASLRTERPDAMARLCLEMAEAHSGEVTTLLWNQDIAQEATNLLKQQELDFVNDSPFTALARCILEAGHAMDEDLKEEVWPRGVQELLQKRQTDHHTYWDSREAKFARKPSNDPLKVLPSLPRPYYFLGDGYSTECLNGQLLVTLPGGESTGRKFTCRHFALAAKDRPKDFFKQIRRSDTSSMAYFELDREHEASRRTRGQRSVQFALAQFGRVLVRIASLVPPGESRSYALGYLSGGREDTGHEMRLFVTNKPSTSEGTREAPQMALKIGVYDPNVTGNMKHLRALHEHLSRLSFDDFVAYSFENHWAVQVLSVELDDPELARALAGQFIPAEVDVQLSSFLNALASGNLNEMKAVERLITLEDFKGLNGRREQLSRALCFALDHEHVDAILQLKGLLPLLDQATIEIIALARDHRGFSKLAHALERKRFAAVHAHCQILLAIGHRLPQSIWRDALEANNVWVLQGRSWKLPCLHRAMWAGRRETVRVILNLFKDLRNFLSEATIAHLLMSADEEGTCGVARALDAGATGSFLAFVQGYLACNPSTSMASALLVQTGKRLRKFIDAQDQVVAASMMRMVIAVQKSPHRLPTADALAMRRAILRACKWPLLFSCLWVERSAYKRLCKDSLWLREYFEDALRLLKS